MKIRLGFGLAVMASLILTPNAFGQVIAFDDFDNDSNLTSFTNNIPGGAFTSAGDGFGEFTRSVDTSIPFNIGDDSVTASSAGQDPFTADSDGFLGASEDFNTIFGITDTVNPDQMEIVTNPTIGTWTFDITSATGPLEVQADFAAFEDWAGSTVNSSADFFYQIDGGEFLPLFTSSIAVGETRTAVMDSGTEVTFDDPVNIIADGTTFEITDDFQTISASVIGLGDSLSIQVRAILDGSESLGLDNLRVVQTVSAIPEPSSATLIGLTGAACFLRRRRS